MPSTIEQRRNEKLVEPDKEKESDWIAFSINVLQNFVITLFIGLIGANFIFLSNSEPNFLEKILPTEEANYFASISRGGGEGGEYYTKKTSDTTKGALEALGIGVKGGFPYKYKKTSNGFIQDFINWMIDTSYKSFSINRSWLQTWIGYFSDKNSFLNNDTFQILLIAPVTLMASILAFPAGFITSLYSSFITTANLGLFWAVLGLFLGYNWIMASTISFVMFIQYLLFFIVMPLLANLTMIKKILHSNVTTLGLLFGALVCGSGIAHLDYITSSVMLVVYVILAIKAIW